VESVADKADHNLCTLDGNGTIRGMGIIAAITPASMKDNFFIKNRKFIVKNC
jgi:hypothetical protein